MKLSSAGAQLVAWLILALVQTAITLDRVGHAVMPGAAKLAMHAYDVGQLLAVGAASALVALAWERLGQRPWWQTALALYVTAFVATFFVLAGDLETRAAKIAGGGAWWWWRVVLQAAFALSVPAAWSAGRLASRGILRVAGIAGALTFALLHHSVLMRLYPGLHLFVVWCSALMLGASLTGLRVVPWLPAALRRRPALLPAALLVLCAPTLLVPGPMVATAALFRAGSVLIPFSTRLHAAWASARTGRRSDERITALRQRSPSPPSTPSLVPQDALVIMVVIDAVRADLFEGNAYRDKLPNLMALRDRSVFFRQARTAAPATVVAISSLFSSRFFSHMAWTRAPGTSSFFPSEDSHPRLATRLSESGMRSTIPVVNGWMAPGHGVFGKVDESPRLPPAEGRHYADAETVTTASLRRLEASSEGAAFFYLHLFEPHFPYDDAGASGSAFERYIADVALADRAVANLVAGLERLGLTDRTVLVLTSDHGQAFGEHNHQYHAVSLYEEVCRVPLLWILPGVSPRTVDDPVSLIDVAPTILDLVGVTSPSTFLGDSLVPYFRSSSFRRIRTTYMEGGTGLRAAVFEDGIKLHYAARTGVVEMFDLDSDPNEKLNIVGLGQGEQGRLDAMQQFFDAFDFEREGYVRPLVRP